MEVHEPQKPAGEDPATRRLTGLLVEELNISEEEAARKLRMLYAPHVLPTPTADNYETLDRDFPRIKQKYDLFTACGQQIPRAVFADGELKLEFDFVRAAARLPETLRRGLPATVSLGRAEFLHAHRKYIRFFELLNWLRPFILNRQLLAFLDLELNLPLFVWIGRTLDFQLFFLDLDNEAYYMSYRTLNYIDVNFDLLGLFDRVNEVLAFEKESLSFPPDNSNNISFFIFVLSKKSFFKFFFKALNFLLRLT